MQELIIEIAIYLGLAAFLGFLLGYLIWGMGFRRRITAARVEGAADMRAGANGDRVLQARIEKLEQERDQLAERVEGLKTHLEEAKSRTAPPDADAPPAGDAPEFVLAAPPEAPDDLTRIRGVGASTAAALNGKGIWLYSQLAGMTPADVQWLREQMDVAVARSVDTWPDQARLLMDE